jgi:replicative DNA helicase
VLQEIRDRKEGRSKTTLHTGIKSVDAVTGGLRRGYLTVIAGLPGSGKTAATLGVLAHNAGHGVPCLFFSIEMDRIDIGVRMLSQNSGVTASVIFDEKSGLESALLRWEDVESASARLGQTLLTLDDRPLALAQIVEQSHRWFAQKVKAVGHENGLIAIDYLGLIKSDEGSDNRNREVAALVQGVKLLARSLRVPIILCAQLNRQAANRDGEPELSDLRDSGEIEAAADLVIFPYPWPRYVNLAGELVMKLPKEGQVARDVWLIRKNRNGAKGAATVMWHPETMHYTAATRPGEAPPPDWSDR